MNKCRLGKASEQWDTKSLDITNWPAVNPAHLSTQDRETFNRRKRALKLYFSGENSIKQILDKTRLSRSGLFRLMNKALTPLDNGEPSGFLACIPNFRFADYVRKKQVGIGTAGLFTQFLEKHPEQKDFLYAHALGKAKVNQVSVRGPYFKAIWLAFIKNCAEAGINTKTDYPFSNSDGGRESVRRYIRNIRATNFNVSAKIEHGDKSGKLAGSRSSLAPPIETVPYRRVQLDAHSIDLILNVRVMDELGNDQDLPLSRIWLIVMLDIASRAVLGYSLSLQHNYSKNDVLNCIASSFEKWTPKDIPNDVMAYLPGAGLPSGVIEACDLRVFDSLQMDNAWSHLSKSAQERILDTGVTEIVTIRPATPRANGYVERFMRTVESLAFHQWPNTTGSNPKDSRRRNPEKAAAQLNIQFADMELAADVVIANYNAHAHSSLNGRSPLDYIQYRLEKQEDLIRYANAESLEELSLFEEERQVTIRANLAQGHKPYIQFCGARYTNSNLQRRLDLNGKKVIFRIDTRDIRYGTLFDPKGQSIGSLSADKRWLNHPHTLAMRSAIFKLMRERILYSNSREPLADYIKYLNQRAIKSRRARTDLVSVETHISDNDTDSEQEFSFTNTKENKRKMGSYSDRYKVNLTTTVNP